MVRQGTAFEMLPCSPLASSTSPCQIPTVTWVSQCFEIAEFQSYSRGIFPLISSLPETSRDYSLPLKVRTFKVASNFRIVFLNLESELVILNWTLELSILTAWHQFKKKKRDTKQVFAVRTCRAQIMDQRAMPTVWSKIIILSTYVLKCVCIYIYVKKVSLFNYMWQWKLSITFDLLKEFNI